MQPNKEAEKYCKSRQPIRRYYDSAFSWWDLYGFGYDDADRPVVYVCWECPPVYKYRRVRLRNRGDTSQFFIVDGETYYLDAFKSL